MLSSQHCLFTTKHQLCSHHAALLPASHTHYHLNFPYQQQSRAAAAHVGPSAALAATAASSNISSRRALVAAASASKKQQGSTAGKGFGSPSKLANKPTANEKRKCPCGSGQVYPSCCGRYHAAGGGLAPTPEALLRSRFSAYALQQVDYLVATTHKQNAEYTGDSKSYARTVKRTAQGTEYLGLKILDLPEEYQARMQQSAAAAAASDGSSSSSEEDAYLKFSVRWRERGAGGPENVATEVSHFKKVDGAWLYYAECE